MKTIVLILLTMLVISSAFAEQTSNAAKIKTPVRNTFKQMGNALHGTIKSLYVIGKNIGFMNLYGLFSTNPSIDTKSDAFKSQLNHFYNSITEEEFASFTEINPRDTGQGQVKSKFGYTKYDNDKCFKDEIKRIQSDFSISQFYSQFYYYQEIMIAYENHYQSHYYLNALKLLKKKKMLFKHFMLTRRFINLIMARFINDTHDKPPGNKTKQTVTKLKKSLKAGQDPIDYIYLLKNKYPECLGHYNPEFEKYMMEEITIIRGQFFLQKLIEQKDRLQPKKHEWLTDVEFIEPDPNSIIYQYMGDEWGYAYYIKYDKNNIPIALISEGADENSDEDNLYIQLKK